MTPEFVIAINYNHTGKVARKGKRWRNFNRTFANVLGSSIEADNEVVTKAIEQGHAVAPVHFGNRETKNFVGLQYIFLDFDTEDDGSRTKNLLADPFIRQHAFIVHATTSHTEAKPRSRVGFRLDQFIHSMATARSYIDALHAMYPHADKKCKSPIGLFFGAKGCEMIARPDKVLPIAVLDQMVAAMPTPAPSDMTVYSSVPTRDKDELLSRALGLVAPGNRNDTGFTLARWLRDAGYSREDAWGIIVDYQRRVPAGNHPYTVVEAIDSLNSAYSRPARPVLADWAEIEEKLTVIECAILSGVIGRVQGATHLGTKTWMEILDIARKAHIVTNLALPITGFIKSGIKAGTARNHLHAFCNAGYLTLVIGGKRPRASEYNINVDLLYQLACSGLDGAIGTEKGAIIDNICRGVMGEKAVEAAVEIVGEVVSHVKWQSLPFPLATIDAMLSTYRELQGMEHFFHGARIALDKWDGPELPDGGFGPVAQKAIALLAHAKPHSKTQLLGWLDCLGVGERTGKKAIRYLKETGLLAYDLDQDDQRIHIPHLVDEWRQRLLELASKLTTSGDRDRTAKRYAMQQIAYHKSLRPQDDEERAISDRVIRRSQQRLEEYKGNERVQKWLANHRRETTPMEGIATAPSLSAPQRPPQAHRKPVQPPDGGQTGRMVTPHHYARNSGGNGRDETLCIATMALPTLATRLANHPP